MSIRINIPEEVGLNSFIIAANYLPIVEARAVDGLRIIFQSLHETSIRLEEKILKTHAPVADGEVIDEFTLASTIASITNDVWIIIDGIRRAARLLEHAPKNGNKQYTLLSLITDIKAARDSFQHLEERIKTYYNQVGGSVLGDVKWRFRAAIGDSEEITVMSSGVSRGIGYERVVQVEEEQFKSFTGIYDLGLFYIEGTRIKNGGKWIPGPVNKIEVDISSAIYLINNLIAELVIICTNVSEENLDKAKVSNDNIRLNIPSYMRARLRKD